MKSDSVSRAWSTPAALAGFGWVLTIAAVLWWLGTPDATDRLFVGILVLVLAAVSAYASLVRPRLEADTDGVTVRSLRGTHSWPWQQVRVLVRHNQRFGRTVETLELEVPEQHRAGGLIVLTKLELGADARDVADQLGRIRP
ncbi:PH domain-containing protein [Haloactinomyces albus]|uniref:Low molecular weight protein antigen 6 PH domain-containing protein n=1 Tax=Haloactinomyces albus TaxID=1352928 RepID=A0AAE3ZDT6_9ACTN|nr:PH domain-containing protein [Haloactinomyces albus]MDR7302000.1 hypothetical protein [Haloactinomyces albus]